MLDRFTITVQANLVSCEDSLSKSLYDLCQSDDFELHPRSQLSIELANVSLYYNRNKIGQYLGAMTFKCGIRVDICMAYIYAHIRFDRLHLDARSQWLDRGKNQR